MALAMGSCNSKFIIINMKVIFLIICVIVIQGCAEKIINTDHPIQLKNFDVEKFNKNQAGGQYNFHVPQSTNNVQQVEIGLNGYYERITNTKSRYGEYREYFQNGKLKQEGLFFNDFMIGIHRIYDKNGKLVDRIDFNKPFPFSIENLIRKIKNKYKIDIADPDKHIFLSRSTNPSSHYDVAIDIEDSSGLQRWLKVDGVTGRILSDTTIEPKG